MGLVMVPLFFLRQLVFTSCFVPVVAVVVRSRLSCVFLVGTPGCVPAAVVFVLGVDSLPNWLCSARIGACFWW
jgi:hypothetical protein